MATNNTEVPSNTAEAPLEIDPESPWVHEAEAIVAATRANAELSYKQALEWRGAQQEAAEAYCAANPY
jgi:excinuclease UvrABC nuclease subunit